MAAIARIGLLPRSLKNPIQLDNKPSTLYLSKFQSILVCISAFLLCFFFKCVFFPSSRTIHVFSGFFLAMIMADLVTACNKVDPGSSVTEGNHICEIFLANLG